MKAGKLFFVNAFDAPWSTQKDIGEIEKSGNQIITLSHLRVRSPKNGTFLERKIFVWHVTIVIGSIISIRLEKYPPNSIQIKIMA